MDVHKVFKRRKTPERVLVQPCEKKRAITRCKCIPGGNQSPTKKGTKDGPFWVDGNTRCLISNKHGPMDPTPSIPSGWLVPGCSEISPTWQSWLLCTNEHPKTLVFTARSGHSGVPDELGMWKRDPPQSKVLSSSFSFFHGHEMKPKLSFLAKLT